MLQPRIRTFSELPGWLASHQQLLASKRVLMYCTGGVRCERASAYLRSFGDAFQDVHQLEGACRHKACRHERFNADMLIVRTVS